MEIGNRIQRLRKTKGLSQEQLANEVGVSRQAVSKWESQQSLPDLDKVIALSEYFKVSTDYLLMGKDDSLKQSDHSTISQVLYLFSTFIIFLGTICCFANWYENQYMTDIFVGLVIVGSGALIYFIATVLSSCSAMMIIKRLNLIIGIYIPLALLCNFVCGELIAPYPLDIYPKIIFYCIYIAAICFIYRKTR